jgi:N6-adenosine-specific RNA methylase IME4
MSIELPIHCPLCSERGRAAIPRSPHFHTIVADPPWPYSSQDLKAAPKHRPNTWNGPTGGVAAATRYETLSIPELCALPVRAVAAPDAHLYLWTTNSFLVEAHEVARAWGFEPKTLITWGKIKQGQSDFVPSMKMGYWFRSATEHVLFAVRGKLRLRTPEALPTLFLHERLPHSAKPESFQDLVEKASPGPYLEMFARRARAGWAVFGHQAPGAIVLGQGSAVQP